MPQREYQHATLRLRLIGWRELCFVFVLLLHASIGLAGTPVARGDVLRVEVLNAPELSREAAVDVDGRITLPLLGSIEVADREIDVIRKELIAAFKERGLLTRPDVLVEVASYRSVYVGGSVGRPGAIDFVPGLTARQALIAAGGLRLGPADPSVSRADILSAMAKKSALQFRFTQKVAEIARLRAEIAGAQTLSDPTDELYGIASADKESVLSAASALLDDVRKRSNARQQHGTELIDLIALELRTLEEQAALQIEEGEVQKSEIENARTLVERGLLPRPRLTELMRVQSQLSQDRLANSAFAARARQAAETVRFEDLDTTLKNREEARGKLSESLAQKSDIASEISALDMRILAAGGGSSARDIVDRLTIFRNIDGASVQISDANLDDAVQPGDVLELDLEMTRSSDSRRLETPTAMNRGDLRQTGLAFELDDRP
jgi:polysaccharide export outer membrane protein